jgi:hypothetical protein
MPREREFLKGKIDGFIGPKLEENKKFKNAEGRLISTVSHSQMRMGGRNGILMEMEGKREGILDPWPNFFHFSPQASMATNQKKANPSPLWPKRQSSIGARINKT